MIPDRLPDQRVQRLLAGRAGLRAKFPRGYWYALGVFAASILLAVALSVTRMPPRGTQPVPVVDRRVPDAPRNVTNAATPPSSSSLDDPTTMGPYDYRLVPDDGRTLWASPTHGAPMECRYVPSGARLVLVIRPADLWAHADGRAVVRALGPQFQSLCRLWEHSIGVPLAQTQQLLVAWLPQDARPPRVVLVLNVPETHVVADRAAEGLSELANHAAWARDLKAFVPAGAQDGWLVLASEVDRATIDQQAGHPPPLQRELDQLRQCADQERHVSILFVRNFLVADGRAVLDGPLAPVRSGLLECVGDEADACLLSFHLSDHFYGEIRLVPRGDVVAHRYLPSFRSRIERLRIDAQKFLAQRHIDPHWQRLAWRFPLMVDFLIRYVRMGIEEQQLVANFALPTQAAHNMTLAVRLGLSAPPGHMAPQTAAASTGSTRAATLEQILEHRMDFEVPQQSLDMALDELASAVHDELPDVQFEIQIRGRDLQMDGITRNQQIRDFVARDQTVADILTGLVMRANPLPAPSPSDPRQQLVWVIPPSPNNPNQRILWITTRRAAVRNRYALPPEFSPQLRAPVLQ